MSNPDSFIDEVTEEVRRDRLYGYLRKYGWIGILIVVLIVAGTAWQSWRTEQQRSAAQDLGDALLSTLSTASASERADALRAIEVADARANAIRLFLQAEAELEAENTDAARESYLAIEANQDLPLIYRQIAKFKSLTVAGDALEPEARRAGFADLTVAGNPLRTLAEEQLAYIDIETGSSAAAIERLEALLVDAEATADLQQRAVQVIVALGGTPEVDSGQDESDTR